MTFITKANAGLQKLGKGEIHFQ